MEILLHRVCRLFRRCREKFADDVNRCKQCFVYINLSEQCSIMNRISFANKATIDFVLERQSRNSRLWSAREEKRNFKFSRVQVQQQQLIQIHRFPHTHHSVEPAHKKKNSSPRIPAAATDSFFQHTSITITVVAAIYIHSSFPSIQTHSLAI